MNYSAKKHWETFLNDFLEGTRSEYRVIVLFSLMAFFKSGGESFEKKNKNLFERIDKELLETLEKQDFLQNELFFHFERTVEGKVTLEYPKEEKNNTSS